MQSRPNIGVKVLLFYIVFHEFIRDFINSCNYQVIASKDRREQQLLMFTYFKCARKALSFDALHDTVKIFFSLLL